MTLKELNKKYSFHDSSLETIIYDREKRTLSMRIAFCTYEQPGFDENSTEAVPISLVFSGVKEYKGLTGSFECFSILDEILENDNTITFCIMDDSVANPAKDGGYYEACITAENAEFTVIEPTGKEYL